MSKVMEVIGELRDGASAILTHIKAGKSIKKDRANKTKSELARSREEKFNAEKATQIQKNALETRFGKFVQDGILVTAFDTDKKKNIEVNAVNEELTTLLNNGNTPISEILASDAYKEASDATRRVIDSAINDEPSGVVERYYDNGEGNIIRINNIYVFGFKTVLDNGENGIATKILSGENIDYFTGDLIDKYSHMDQGGGGPEFYI